MQKQILLQICTEIPAMRCNIQSDDNAVIMVFLKRHLQLFLMTIVTFSD